MKTNLKLAAAAAILAGGLTSTAAFAQTAPCPLEQLLGDWTGSCLNGDKLYEFSLGDIDFGPADESNTRLQIEQLGLLDEVHNFSFDFISALEQGDYSFMYTITIVDPDKWFKAVSIDSDVPAQLPGVNFTKRVDTDATWGNGSDEWTLVSASGNPDFQNLTNQYTKLWIYGDITVGANGAINSATDTYTQQVPGIPEPGTLALLGLGLAGLGFARRRKG